LIFEIRSGSEACGESRDTDFHGRQDGRFGENEGAHRSPTAVHTGLSHTENHTMSSSRPTWCSDRHLIHSHNTPDTSTYERDRMRSRTREDHTSYTFNTLASFSCSRVGTRTALTDTVLSRRTPGQPRVRTRATTSPDWRVDRGGHTYNTHTTIAARHFALAPRSSGPLGSAHHLHNLTRHRGSSSLMHLSLSALASHGNTGSARASACGHMNHDYARPPVCTTTASRGRLPIPFRESRQPIMLGAHACHAAGVEDSMIQLICLWMCPESLHVYRRMGVAEHETLIRKASGCHVDCTQSVNIPVVVCDRAHN